MSKDDYTDYEKMITVIETRDSSDSSSATITEIGF